MNRLATLSAVLAAAAAALVLNLVLLSSASSGNGSIGKLGPTARLPAQRLSPPRGVVQPTTGPVRGEGRDD